MPNVTSRSSLINRLQRGRKARQDFVASHLSRTIAFQIRAFREQLGWSQKDLGDALGTSQNAIYRLESPRLTRPTMTTLKKIAATMDVAVIVRFVPYDELVDWVSGTPRLERGLRSAALDVRSVFAKKRRRGTRMTS